MLKNIPLSLYIHLPWCIHKCPYCDFNSHALRSKIPEENYLLRLKTDLDNDILLANSCLLKTIFFGGGTPSLFSGKAIKEILENVHAKIHFDEEIEITLEANPGTVEQQRFNDYFKAGVNRLSIGVQSFQDEKLKVLGRIHSANEAVKAISVAKSAGFNNFNIDLMFGLPNQTIEDALYDLQQAIDLQPTHISWYQLTLEPNTLFHAKPPVLPDDEVIWEMQQAGQLLLEKYGYTQYEISAYAQTGKQSLHNLNYWQFGDYLGIGAGAHSKLTKTNGEIIRQWKIKNPKDYLNPEKNLIGEQKIVSTAELPFEFMLNALRLNQAIPFELFEQRTGLPIALIQNELAELQSDGLIIMENNCLQKTALGEKFLNNITEKFLKS